MQYSVTLREISETDQLVFRLIFSLSEKVAGREHSYRLCAEEPAAGQIVIQGSGPASVPMANGLDMVVQSGIETTQSPMSYVIRKPLIATRVLSVLDRFVEEVLSRVPIAPQDEPVARAEAEPAATVEFSISEAEASELAIVDDEALENPANQSADVEQQSDPGKAHEPVPALSPVQKPSGRPSLVMLPRAPVATEAQPAAADEKQLPRALVVDDSPSVRKQLELELDLFEVDVEFAGDAAQAGQMLAQRQYDVVFLDVVLPDGDGFQICKSIKQATKQTKVVMLTGKATPADKIKGTMAGCDAYLVKPVGRMTFQNTACTYLQLREQAEVIHA